MVKVSIIVATYNRPDRLDKLLEVLNHQTFKDFEVVVVHDGPTDYKPKKQGYSITFDMLPVHKGFASTLNKCISLAKGEIVAKTDDDCIPDPNWLEKGLEYFKFNGIIAVEGLIYTDKPYDLNYRTVHNLYFLNGKKNKWRGYIGANMFFRKSILDELKGYDERFNGYFREDTDLAWRIIKSKKGIIYFNREARIFHPAVPWSKEGNVEKNERKFRAKMHIHDGLLFKKHPLQWFRYLSKPNCSLPRFILYFIRGLFK